MEDTIINMLERSRFTQVEEEALDIVNKTSSAGLNVAEMFSESYERSLFNRHRR